jgi:2',3'-cyclic-nucleotide 2'-phosphodiesterase (5'-nucleotidase family)
LPPSGAQRFTLAQASGLRLGVTGAASSECGPAAPAVTLLDPVTALREVVPQIRAAGAQVVVVVVLSHLTYEEMEQVARQVDGVNVIVGSHAGPQPYGFLDKPRVVGRTILSVAGNDMAAVGQVDLVVRRSDAGIVRFGFRRHVVTPDGPASPAVHAVLDGYLAKRAR